MAHKAKLFKEIEHQLALEPEGLAKKDRFLLECNFDELSFTSGKVSFTSGKDQAYWLLAIRAAKEASLIHTDAGDEMQHRPRKCQRGA